MFRLLVENVEDYAMFALDPDGHIIYWNAGAALTLGYDEEEVLGRSLAMFFTEEDQSAGIVEHELSVAAAQGRSEDERWHVRKDGSRFWATGIVVPVRDPAGALVGFGKILRDHTDLKELQETLRNRASDLAQANEDKNVFLATLVHELRTPLGVLMNSAEPLKKKAAIDPVQIAGMIDRQVQHTRLLVDDLMDIVRVARNKLQLRRAPLDLRDTIRQAADMVQPLATSRGVDFKLAQPTCELRIAGDCNRVLQIFVNLLNNALKFTEAGGLVTVAVSCEGSEAVARIVDNGVGIPPDQLSSIFELFSQAHTALPGSQLGVGIGLALTRDLVLLLLAALSFLVHEGVANSNGPGDVVVSIAQISETRDGYLVRFQVRNDGSRTLGNLHMSARLSDGETAIEVAHAVIDFLPADPRGRAASTCAMTRAAIDWTSQPRAIRTPEPTHPVGVGLQAA